MKNICYNCGSEKVIWQNSWDLDEYYGTEDKGVVNTYVCADCGADIEVAIRFEEQMNEEKNDD